MLRGFAHLGDEGGLEHLQTPRVPPQEVQSCDAPNPGTGGPENPSTQVEHSNTPSPTHPQDPKSSLRPGDPKHNRNGLPRFPQGPQAPHPATRRLSPSAPSIVSAAGSLDYF